MSALPTGYRLRMIHPAAQYAGTIAKFQAQFFEERPTAYIGAEWWLVFHNGKPVAFAGMLASTVESGSMYLNRSGVLAEHRGKGLQVALIKARLKRAKQLGAKWATSDTYDNPHSSNNLIACGFRAYRPEHPWRSEGTMYWRRRL